VLATQNPIEQEGTYPLPEAQLDRFMFAIELKYPSISEEIEVVKTTTNDELRSVNALMDAKQIIEIQHLIRRIPVPENVVSYTVNLVNSTRPGQESAPELVRQFVDWGAGPRASQNLVLAAKAHAAINGKYSPDIDDVQAVSFGILRHRIIRNYKAEAEGISEEDIIRKLM
jgi:MoxR-like ATPase